MSKFPAPRLITSVVELLVGGPHDGMYKWTVDVQGVPFPIGAGTITPPTFSYPIYCGIYPDPFDIQQIMNYPIIEGVMYEFWNPYDGGVEWSTETNIMGRDSSEGLGWSLDGSGHPPHGAFYNWDITSVKDPSITHIGEVFYLPAPDGTVNGPDSWTFAFRQIVRATDLYQLWSDVLHVHVDLTGSTTTTDHSAFGGSNAIHWHDPNQLGVLVPGRLFNNLTVWQGDALDSLSEVDSSGNSSVDGGVTFDAVEGEEYYIQVGCGRLGCNGAAVLNWDQP